MGKRSGLKTLLPRLLCTACNSGGEAQECVTILGPSAELLPHALECQKCSGAFTVIAAADRTSGEEASKLLPMDFKGVSGVIIIKPLP